MAQRQLTSSQSPVEAEAEAEAVEKEGDANVKDPVVSALFFGYFGSRAKNDLDTVVTEEVLTELSKEEENTGGEEVDFAKDQGAKLGRYGDLLTRQNKREMKEIVDYFMKEMSLEKALKKFKKVVKGMFQNARGEIEIKSGRVLVLLALCFELCVAYIKKSTGIEANNTISFILQMASWLCMTFFQYQLKQWMITTFGGSSGWVTEVTYSCWPKGKNGFLLMGIVYLSIYGILCFVESRQ